MLMSVVITRANSDASSVTSEEEKLVTLFDDAKDIFILDETNFDRYVYEPNTRWVVTFYAEWCGWSKRFAPELKLASEQLKDTVNIGVVNCAEHRQLKKRFKVNRYPTIFMIDGEGAENQQAYNGPREEEAFVKAVHKKFKDVIEDDEDTNLVQEDGNVSAYE